MKNSAVNKGASTSSCADDKVSSEDSEEGSEKANSDKEEYEAIEENPGDEHEGIKDVESAAGAGEKFF